MNAVNPNLELALEYSFFLNNLIASTFNSAVDAKIFDHTIKFKSRRKVKKFIRKFSEWTTEEYQKFLIENDNLDGLYFITIKNVIRAVLLDLQLYVFEALENINKGQVSIAYSLLRKPFKENLFILEWIAGDPTDFFFKYNFEDAKKYSPVQLQCDKQFIQEITTKAIKNISINSFYDPEFIFQLRYDKSQFYSFDQLWNLSTHLVTDRNHIKTDTCNFNFIFSNDKDKNAQLKHIYNLLPYLLFYAVDIVEAAMKRISHLEFDSVTQRRYMGMLVWLDQYYLKNSTQDSNEMYRILKEMGDLIEDKCEKCSAKYLLDIKQMRNICFESYIECQVCGNILEIE